jgi:pantoate--beta-alanine ligase
MILFKKADDLRKYLDNQRSENKKIGFAPTMGALHAGHISLIKTSKGDNAITVSSIFVNPTQFNDHNDFKKYPITIEMDIQLLEEAGCDILFLPSINEIYPEGINVNKQYDLGFIETVFDGKYRPGHFQGVCMVVQQLLEIVHPNHLYLGQKDYQQCMVITKLVELIGLKNSIRIIICPTLREANGLAMSSRNMRLSNEEKEKAGVIYKSLQMIKESVGKENPETLEHKAQQMLETAGLEVDYVEIVNAENLSPMKEWDQQKKAVVLIAAFMNEVRLIDNMLLN